MQSPETSLDAACAAWEDRADARPLRRWLAVELDPDGGPRRLDVGSWDDCLARLRRAERARGGWSDSVRERVGGLFAWRVHLSRPDGSPMLGPIGRDRGRGAALREASGLATDPAHRAVLSRWFPSELPPGRRPVPPPLPAVADDDRVLAVLRPDWHPDGDWLAVDHRALLDAARVELAGTGRPWLLGDWRSDGLGLGDVPVGPARPSSWTTNPRADAIEWTYRAGPTRVTRSAVLLRYRKVALLAQQEDGPSASAGLRLALADGVTAAPADDLRAWTLSRSRSTARLIPIGLPPLPYPTDRGSLAVEGREAVLRVATTGRRRWLPLVVAWGKAPTGWRTLTVTENSRVCPTDVAFAARLAWGPGEDGLLLYRSLARPALRAVLGHQTRARFLVARFSTEGDVEPLLSLD